MSSGTIGLGREPVKTRKQAEQIMHDLNSRHGT